MRLRRPLPELQTVQLPVCCLSCRLSYTTALLPTCEPHVTLSHHASAVASELATSRPDQIKMHKIAKNYAPGSEELDQAGHASLFKTLRHANRFSSASSDGSGDAASRSFVHTICDPKLASRKCAAGVHKYRSSTCTTNSR